MFEFFSLFLYRTFEATCVIFSAAVSATFNRYTFNVLSATLSSFEHCLSTFFTAISTCELLTLPTDLFLLLQVHFFRAFGSERCRISDGKLTFLEDLR